MRARCKLPKVGSVLALVVVLAGCTKGGQFDPTTILDNNMFDNKKPLPGQRELVFPNGVPGVTTGIPADLYKGYQPPPEPAADNAAALTPVVPPSDDAARAEAATGTKAASGKPKVVRARRKRRPEIRVGLAKHPKAAAKSAPQTSQTAWPAPPAAPTQSSETAWPAPPSTSQAQSPQTVWPAPPSTSQAQSPQTVWPAPPPTSSVQQSSQSIWPAPPATGGSTQ